MEPSELSRESASASRGLDMNDGYAVVSGGKLRHITKHEPTSALSQRRFAPGTVFGLHLCSLSYKQVAAMVLTAPRALEQGVGVIATANIQHVAQMRRNRAFAEAMTDADLVTCDGFPVYRYAALRGVEIQTRTTGRDIVAYMMNEMPIAEGQRIYFLLDSEETAVALDKWRTEKGLQNQVTFEVAPMHFVLNDDYCADFSERVKKFNTTVLMLCVGAPQSEVFCQRYRALLPACWALCVGQSAKIVLGLAPTPPHWVEVASIEWLWRIWLEPRRLFKRYATSVIGYLSAILEDLKVMKPSMR